MNNKVSVIIPSYNSWRTIEHALKALASQLREDSVSEIIIVDSSDDNKTKQKLLEYQSEKIKVINVGVRVMPAIARNIGAKEAKENILAFIDSDAYPASDWSEEVLAVYNKGYIVGGGSISLADFQKNRLIPLAQFFLQFNEFMDVGVSIIKKFVPSCNMFCDRALFEKIGGFPEIRASEDVLFGLKVNKVAEVWFMPEIRAFHIFRQDFSGFLKNQILLGKYILIYRCLEEGSKFCYKGLFPLFFLPAFLLIKFLRIILRIVGGNPSLFLRFLLCFPLFILGLFFWGIGFAKGVFSD